MSSPIRTVCPKTLAVQLLNADFDSDVCNVDQIVQGSVDLTWVGGGAGLEGALTMQASNDQVNWCALGDACEISGASGHQLILFDKFEYNWIRAQYVNDTHTAGTITVKIRTKSGL